MVSRQWNGLSQTELLHTMCHDVLRDGDVKAISRSRGFSAGETGTRVLFESFCLSEIGVAQVLQALSRTEIVPLHLLNSRAEAVDGDLRMGDRRFAVSTLAEMQTECWEAAAPQSKNTYFIPTCGFLKCPLGAQE